MKSQAKDCSSAVFGDRRNSVRLFVKFAGYRSHDVYNDIKDQTMATGYRFMNMYDSSNNLHYATGTTHDRYEQHTRTTL